MTPDLNDLTALRLPGARVPVVGFCAYSGSGKTTLARQVIELLCEHTLRVGVIKQARDDFDVDRPDKDSARLRAAGVSRLLLGSERQAALIHERVNDTTTATNKNKYKNGNDNGNDNAATGPTDRNAPDTSNDVAPLLDEFDQQRLDLILVEGFADGALPKLELRRAGATDRPPRYPHDPWVVAVVSDIDALTPPPPPRLARLDINDPPAVAAFIRRRFLAA